MRKHFALLAAVAATRPVWQALQQRVDDLLGGIALADLMKHETQVQELVAIAPTV